MSKHIDITNDIDFVDIDLVIERLQAHRAKYGKCVVDVTVEREAYADSDHAVVSLKVKE